MSELTVNHCIGKFCAEGRRNTNWYVPTDKSPSTLTICEYCAQHLLGFESLPHDLTALLSSESITIDCDSVLLDISKAQDMHFDVQLMAKHVPFLRDITRLREPKFYFEGIKNSQFEIKISQKSKKYVFTIQLLYNSKKINFGGGTKYLADQINLGGFDNSPFITTFPLEFTVEIKQFEFELPPHSKTGEYKLFSTSTFDICVVDSEAKSYRCKLFPIIDVSHFRYEAQQSIIRKNMIEKGLLFETSDGKLVTQHPQSDINGDPIELKGEPIERYIDHNLYTQYDNCVILHLSPKIIVPCQPKNMTDDDISHIVDKVNWILHSKYSIKYIQDDDAFYAQLMRVESSDFQACTGVLSAQRNDENTRPKPEEFTEERYR